MLAKRSEIPSLQSDFYRIQFHKLLRWLMIAIIIILLLLLVISYLILVQKPQKYFANTTSGKILQFTHYKVGLR